MQRLQTKKKTEGFQGSKKTFYFTRNENIITFYAAFIVKPQNNYVLNLEREEKRRRFYEEKTLQRKDSLLTILNEVKKINLSIHRMFLPANVRKKKETENNQKRNNSSQSLLDEILEEKKSTIGVSLSFYFLKAWKNYDLEKTFLSREELVDDFATCLRSELKQKLEAIGKIGRIVGESLKELVLYGTLEKENFLGKNNKTFSQLTKNYATVEKNEDFIRNFIPGPAVDLRPESVFPFPSSVESDPKLFLGRTENETDIGLLPNASFPILIAGDKKTREISTCRILEQEKKFIILDPRSNLEFEDRIKKPFKSLKLGENFFFNVLSPSTSQEYISEEISSQYLGNFIDLVRSITET
ncbi:MAG: hypothetical protein ACTSSF_11765, partial [Candidatus Heimdallarchaeaceae archaeon]